MSSLNPTEPSLSLVWIDYRSSPRCHLHNFTFYFSSQYKVPRCRVWESQFPLSIWGPKGQGEVGSSLDGGKSLTWRAKNCVIEWTVNFNIYAGFSPWKLFPSKELKLWKVPPPTPAQDILSSMALTTFQSLWSSPSHASPEREQTFHSHSCLGLSNFSLWLSLNGMC